MTKVEVDTTPLDVKQAQILPRDLTTHFATREMAFKTGTHSVRAP